MRKILRDAINKRARELLHSGICPTWRLARSKADSELRCGARTRTGKPCRARPLLPRRRCRNHGGIGKPVTEEIRALLRAHAAAQPRDHRGWFIKLEAQNADLRLIYRG
jgi:hypothetical protein